MNQVEHVSPVTGDVVCGSGILRDEIATIGDYVAITSTTPWAIVEATLPHDPSQVFKAETLERSALDELEARIPRGARIVGFGGGLVLDVAKYIGYLRRETPVLVPTVLSSNGPFTDWISVRRDGRPAGFQERGLPRRVVVDVAVIARSDIKINRAGYGDLLPLQTTLNDWRIASTAARGAPLDPRIDEAGRSLMRRSMDSAREISAMDEHGIRLLSELMQATTSLMLSHPDAPISAGSEHLFAWTLESLTGRHFLHGELVALGIVISSILQQRDGDALRRALDEAQVAWRPAQLGLSWEEIERTLCGIQAYNREVRHFDTVYDDIAWTPQRLSSIRHALSIQAPQEKREKEQGAVEFNARTLIDTSRRSS